MKFFSRFICFALMFFCLSVDANSSDPFMTVEVDSGMTVPNKEKGQEKIFKSKWLPVSAARIGFEVSPNFNFGWEWNIPGTFKYVHDGPPYYSSQRITTDAIGPYVQFNLREQKEYGFYMFTRFAPMLYMSMSNFELGQNCYYSVYYDGQYLCNSYIHEDIKEEYFGVIYGGGVGFFINDSTVGLSLSAYWHGQYGDKKGKAFGVWGNSFGISLNLGFGGYAVDNYSYQTQNRIDAGQYLNRNIDDPSLTPEEIENLLASPYLSIGEKNRLSAKLKSKIENELVFNETGNTSNPSDFSGNDFLISSRDNSKQVVAVVKPSNDKFSELNAEEFGKRAAEAEKQYSESGIMTIPSAGLLFQIGKSEVLPYYNPMLDSFIKLYKQGGGNATILIEAYSSNGGNETVKNPNLSKQRAKSVYQYLVNNGISKENITVKAYSNKKIGEGLFQGDTGCKAGQCYRRVDIRIIDN